MAVRSRPSRSGKSLGAVLCASSLLLAGCGGAGGAEDSAGGESVPAGATKEDYAAALADMEPITLTTQSPESPGAAGARATEEYAAAIEEWSDGKITVEIAYGNAIAAADAVEDALADGRLDFNVIIPQYDPAR
jgi:TRAP-type C4-dicarboxylate transport system substrate-binding protein